MKKQLKNTEKLSRNQQNNYQAAWKTYTLLLKAQDVEKIK
jgi:hypothetical protein